MTNSKEDIKIKTPYGNKNWSFVKRCIENHDALLEACKAQNEQEARKEWGDRFVYWPETDPYFYND